MLGDPAAYIGLMARRGVRPLPLAAQVAATAAFLGVPTVPVGPAVPVEH